MASELLLSPESAGQDFRRARRQAALQYIISRLTGKSTELFSYEEVRRKLRGVEGSARLLADIPLDAVVGSVGRYNEFTRDFLPRKTIRSDRWIRVKMAMVGLQGVPPIEVYQIGNVYFVQDGNHRVSVARQMGLNHIQAYVTPVRTRVPLSPKDQPDDLILKAEYAEFLEQTHIDEVRPGANLIVTCPGRYPILLEHIEVHRYFMGLEQRREIPYREAVAHWYDTVYLPVVQLIREQGIMRNFPRRTETDLYLYISQHRAELEESLGWEISLDAAVDNLTIRFNPDLHHRTFTRAGARLRHTLQADQVELSLPAEQTRKEHRTLRREDRVVDDILVSINGEESGWNTLEQAFVIARREGARLHGLHVVSSESRQASEPIQALQAEFDRRCQAAGIRGRLAIEVGECIARICERGRWTDLVIAGVTCPPSGQQPARIGSRLRTLIRRSPSPVLVVPGSATPLDRVLLAYDGSSKAEEALFIATYLAGWWNASLVVVTVNESEQSIEKIQTRARQYLESHKVQAMFVREARPVGRSILKTAAAHQSDLIVMGGYGYTAPLDAVLGSAVDEVLNESERPVLICR